MGFGEEADKARARLEAEDAAEDRRRRQNWAAIDSLVQEFIVNAAERRTPTQGGVFKEYWCVKHAQSEDDTLRIYKNGDWDFRRRHWSDIDGSITEHLAFSVRGQKKDPEVPNPVEGLREGAMRLLGMAKESVMGVGDEADRAKAEHQVDDAAAFEQRRQNWAAIDSLVQEFIPEALRRKTPKARGLLRNKRYWRVKHAQSERDELLIYENGRWYLQRKLANIEILAFSIGGRTRGPEGPNPVEGLRDGAMRLLNS